MLHGQNCIGFVCTCAKTSNDSLFKEGHVLRHRDALDTDLIVSEVISKNETGVSLWAKFYNRNYEFVIDQLAEPVQIKSEDYYKWSLVRKMSNV